MQRKNKSLIAGLQVLTSLLAFAGVTIQVALSKDSIYNMLSYFTIQSNLMVAIGLLLPLIAPETRAGKYFAKDSVTSALLLYILITGLIYNLLLRGSWHPKGADFIADNLVHVAVPLLFTVNWIFTTAPKSLKWKMLPSWTVYPLLYLAYTLVRGNIIKWYPYPFMKVTELGYQRVLFNAAMMTLLFLLLSIAVVAFNRRRENAKVS